MKRLAPVFLSCLLLSVVARAEDGDDAPAPGSGRPEAAAAARDKGYQADKAEAGVVPGDSDEANPIERHDAPGSSNGLQSPPPAQRKIGKGSDTDSPSGGGVGGGGGVACEKSIPALTAVHRYELPDLASMVGRVFDYQMRPNEAVSFKFTAPKSGSGGFALNETPYVPSVMAYATISSVPCDFSTSGGLDPNGVISGSCHIGRVFPNVSFTVNGSGKLGTGCGVKPGGTYYFNIRFLGWNGKEKSVAYEDSCASLIKQFGPGANGKCGGLFSFNGSFDTGKPASSTGLRRDMFLK